MSQVAVASSSVSQCTPNGLGSSSMTSHDMEVDSSDDGEPRLQIVDEVFAHQDAKSEQHHRPASRSSRLHVIKKSLSVDSSSAHLKAYNPQRHVPTRNDEAIESLLLLGQCPVVSPQPKEGRRSNSFLQCQTERRYSSSSDLGGDSRSDPGTPNGQGPPHNGERVGATYYQRMRERNNEASKRCRLKRRLKAESVETQGDLLSTTNKYLKHRILKMEKLGRLFKEGVRQIKDDSCNCIDVVAKARNICQEFKEAHDMNTRNLIEHSRSYRTQNIDLVPSLAGSSDEDIAAATHPKANDQLPPTPPASAPANLHGHMIPFVSTPEITVPVTGKPPPTPNQKSIIFLEHIPKTPLDNIHDIIEKSMDTPPPSAVPLNFALKPTHSTSPTSASEVGLVLNPGPHALVPSVQNPPHQQQHLILLSPPAKRKLSSTSPLIAQEGTKYNHLTSTIKCEPEIQLVECVTQSARTHEGVGSTQMCIAALHGNAQCGGELVDLNQLTSNLDLITFEPKGNMETSAIERAILLSRLKLPFFKANEASTFICEQHRFSLIHDQSKSDGCSLCSKKKTKRHALPQHAMWTITYRMSLEHATLTGNMLPIGKLVCGLCKEKYLKGIDFSHSQMVDLDPISTLVQSRHSPSVSITSITSPPPGGSPAPSPPNRMKVASLLSTTSGVTISRSQPTTNTIEIKCVESVQQIPRTPKSPLQNHITLPVPPQPIHQPRFISPKSPPTTIDISSPEPTPRGGGNIFSKIGRLNEALQAINPRYKPIGFSITSIESCSPNILADAVMATETAVSTLMSVIAPGQEAYLWNALKPKLDSTYRGGSLESHLIPKKQ